MLAWAVLLTLETLNEGNMKAPKCRVCGVEHWPREPHKFGNVAPVSELLAHVVHGKPVVHTVVHAVVNTVVHKRGEARYLDREKRKAYRRIWMQTKRAIAAGRAEAI